MSTNQLVRVQVKNIATGGAGVGIVTEQEQGSNLLGITAFVPFAARGELVSSRIVELKKNHVHAQLVDIERASPERVIPKCDVFMTCGGCELQHMSYESQLEAKREMIVGAVRAAKLPTSAIQSVQPVVAGSSYNYRRRINLHIDSSGSVGFYRNSTRAVVQITNCPIAVPAINDSLKNIQEFGKAVAGLVSSVALETDMTGTIARIVSPYDLGSTEIEHIEKSAKYCFENAAIVVGGKEISGYGRKILKLPLNEKGSLTLQIPVGSFSQVNWNINLALIKRIVSIVGTQGGKSIVDLYAGAGNFSLPLANAGHDVVAIESDKQLASFGRENAERYSFANRLSFLETSVEDFLQTPSRFDVVIADPPRTGLGKLVTKLPKTSLLLFIGCHLPSFIRDIKALVEHGWNVESIEPFDMFAQTSYVETLGVLTRNHQ